MISDPFIMAILFPRSGKIYHQDSGLVSRAVDSSTYMFVLCGKLCVNHTYDPTPRRMLLAGQFMFDVSTA